MLDADVLLQILSKQQRLAHVQSSIEFKSNLDDHEAIGRYLSALSNSAALLAQDRAWMVWGVADGSHDICGTRFDPFTKKVGNQALAMWLQLMTQPRADFAFHVLGLPQGRVVMLEIHPARSAPVAFQHVRYIRVDSHTVPLSAHPDKEARLWSRLGLKEDWTGLIVPGASLGDLDTDALAAARLRYADYLVRGEPDTGRHDALRQEVAALSTVTLLNKARLTKEGRVTRAALLLLGKDEVAHYLSPVDAKISWTLRDAEDHTVTSQHFGPPFLLATERAFARVRNVTLDHMPDGTLFPTPVQQYDHWVLREALHNAVAHQDYQLGGRINLVEYPDRVVLSNLGQFIPGNVEWMLEHQSPPEHYRNQWLIDGMIRLRMIEQAGSGIRRMFATQRQRLFPLPDFSFEATAQGHPRVELTVRGQVLDTRFARALIARNDLTLGQVLLLDRIQKGRPLSTEAARTLRNLGLIEGRAPRYFISAKVAEATGQKARYIQNRGLDDSYYQRLVLDYLGQYGRASRADLDSLLLSKLPDVLTDGQKANKQKNPMQYTRRDGLVHRVGSRSQAVWLAGSAHPPDGLDKSLF